MSICASGASHIKASSPASLMITSEYMASALPPALAWLVPFLPYIQPILIENVATFCASDPPGNPSLVGVTIGAVLAGGELGAAVVASDAIGQLLLNYFWYRACECTSGTTPAAPAAPAAPSGLPVINPPGLVNTGTGYCIDDFSGVGSSFDPTGLIASTAFQASPTVNLALVNSQTLILDYTRNSVGAGPHQASMFEPVFGHGLGAAFSPPVIKSEISVASGSTFQQVFPIPPDIHAFKVNLYSPATSTDTYSVRYRVVCDVPPGTVPGNACCPPDTNLQGLVRQLAIAVELIQRQAAPFGYVPGAVHAGLSNNGSLSIADLLGVKIEVTTLPDSYGRQSGDPIEFFGLGFLSWGTADGYRTSSRLEHEFQVIFPPLAGVYTTLGYTLAPGVVATVTELIREP